MRFRKRPPEVVWDIDFPLNLLKRQAVQALVAPGMPLHTPASFHEPAELLNGRKLCRRLDRLIELHAHPPFCFEE